jgi:hypothetical protein
VPFLDQASHQSGADEELRSSSPGGPTSPNPTTIGTAPAPVSWITAPYRRDDK